MVDGRRLFNDMARVASGAAGALGGVRSRMEGELRDHAERFLARMNLVTREEYDIVAAMARTARDEQERLAERLAAIEATLAAQARPETPAVTPAPAAPAPTPRKSAAAKAVATPVEAAAKPAGRRRVKS
jgi:BMFP domain-containing protein YqiC